MKIYTRTGDSGTTGLFGGGRVTKDHLRVEAYGGSDELNSIIGLARTANRDADVERSLARVQVELFHLGAELATAPGHEGALPANTRLGEDSSRWMEEAIDSADGELPPLRSFVLPGGTAAAAQLHLARTVCRRSERALVALSREEPVSSALLVYLNRLSDLLFTLARLVNHREGISEQEWSVR